MIAAAEQAVVGYTHYSTTWLLQLIEPSVALSEQSDSMDSEHAGLPWGISHDGSRGIQRKSPFYCPNDKKVYLDTSFFQELDQRFRGCDVGSKACQFSQAYVIAHEIGHHVQNLLGILPTAQQMLVGSFRNKAAFQRA